MYVQRPRLFLGIGALLIPLTVVDHDPAVAAPPGVDAARRRSPGEGAGAFAFLALVIGTTLALLGLGLVQAATACALVEIDAGRPIGPLRAYRLALPRLRPLLGAIALFVVAVVAPHRDRVPHPGRDLARRPLVPARARRRARGRARRSAALRRSGASSGIAGSGSARSSGSAPWSRSLPGPLLGVALIFLTSMPFAFLNIVAGVVYALAAPVRRDRDGYVYFDARARGELEHVRAAAGAPGRDRARAGLTPDQPELRSISSMR